MATSHAHTTYVDPRLTSMPMEFLDCREMGHAWDRMVVAAKRRAELAKLGQWQAIRSCNRCGMRRVDLYDRSTMELLDRAYEAPDGYYLQAHERAEGRLSRADVRRAVYVAEMQAAGVRP
jgi:hypothetical protein